MHKTLHFNILHDKFSLALLKKTSLCAFFFRKNPVKFFDGQAETMTVRLVLNAYSTIKTASRRGTFDCSLSFIFTSSGASEGLAISFEKLIAIRSQLISSKVHTSYSMMIFPFRA